MKKLKCKRGLTDCECINLVEYGPGFWFCAGISLNPEEPKYDVIQICSKSKYVSDFSKYAPDEIITLIDIASSGMAAFVERTAGIELLRKAAKQYAREMNKKWKKKKGG